jgi:hypothetical protein
VNTASCGTGAGSLDTKVFDALVSRGKARLVQSNLVSEIVGDNRRRNAVVAEMNIRHLRHTNLSFSDHWGPGTNILGLGFWERYNVTFDFPNHLIYLQPSKQINKPDTQDLSGLKLGRIDGRVVVKAVDKESPAARAGIQAQDVLLRIDGEDGTSIRLYEILLRLHSEGKTVRLTIKRGDRLFGVGPTCLRASCPGAMPADRNHGLVKHQESPIIYSGSTRNGPGHDRS